MSDPTFDPRLASQLRRYADRVVVPFDPLAVATAAIAKQPARARRPDIRLLSVAAILMLAISLAVALAAGARPMESGRPTIVYADTDGTADVRSAWRIDPGTGRAWAVVDQEPDVSVAPDGRHAVFRIGSDVHLRDTRTGAETVLVGAAAGVLRSRSDLRRDGPPPPWRDFTWSPGGTWVSWMACASGRCRGTIAASDGSGTHWMPRAGPDPVEASATAFWWWTDEDHLFVGPEHGGLLTANGDGSGARHCESEQGCTEATRAVQWGTDGSSIQLTGPAAEPLEVSWDGQRVADFSVSPDSRVGIAIVSSLDASPNPGRLWLVYADGSKALVDTGPALVSLGRDLPAYSPDGSRMVIGASVPAADGGPAVPVAFIVDLRSGRPVARLDDVVMASWSPDGSRLALVGTGGRQVQVARADGSDRHPVGSAASGMIDQLVWAR